LKKDKHSCQNCGAHVNTIPTPTHTVYHCQQCGYKRIEKDVKILPKFVPACNMLKETYE
jgi:DNA-directed RNA polymerase subunit RPC12/RpoP